MELQRPSWDEYFMERAELARKRTTCLRRGVGAVIVKDNRVMATGYNGVPKGITHCSEAGCLRQQMNVPSGKMHELCRGLHAEQNAIIQAACLGQSIEGATLYCTTQPCIIKRVVVKESYPDELASKMAEEAGLKIEVL